DTFGLLPQITWKTQPVKIGKTNLYFNQDTSFTTFVTDLDGTRLKDDLANIERVDLHPQISAPVRLFPWLQFTPQVGFRETFYSDGFKGVTRLGTVSRELVDIQGILDGPKIDRILTFAGGDTVTRLKHLIEPRLQYDFIPDMDKEDRAKIRVLDGVDSVSKINRISYFLTQRLLKKVANSRGKKTTEIARFEVSQSYDFNEAGRELTSPTDNRLPFSTLRFDWDSRPLEGLMVNFDATYNIYTSIIEAFNMDVGIKPLDGLSIVLERRLLHNTSATLLGTISYSFLRGWSAIFSTRFDEFNEEILEKNGRLTFNDPCKCWGFSIDLIQRLNIAEGVRQNDTRVLFNLTLRGLGAIEGSQGESFIHRSF
ncbi:MAG: LPS assembly protein LptD, partial [Nitrospinaceae bacterium]